ncbi:MAG: AraC family transcriptional regulator [Clostridia bacterium]|nr:AraC family transcriptional regulator [Clostridia bacterium]
MTEPYFEEHLIHGTAEFPVGIYDMHFNSDEKPLFPLHYHSEFEFLIITAGEATVHINGEPVVVKKGEGAFINSSALHSAVNSADLECGFIAIVFSPQFIAPKYEDIYDRYISAVMDGNIEIPRHLPTDAVALAYKINNAYKDKPFGYELLIKAHLTEMMSMCVATGVQARMAKENAKTDIVKRVLDYIHDNYMNEISLDDLALSVHISKEHLCRVFREVSDYSPIVYLNRYRIIQSAYMLRNNEKSISQISSDCGFNSSSYFNKQFMRFMKCSPSRYRKNSM